MQNNKEKNINVINHYVLQVIRNNYINRLNDTKKIIIILKISNYIRAFINS